VTNSTSFRRSREGSLGGAPRTIATAAAVLWVATLLETPVAAQEHKGRQAVSGVDLSTLRAWDAAIDQ
jgi:hypothetical protein